MDSKVVTRQIRKEIWPVLKAHGFDKFVGRTAWRHSSEKIDVVNFQSFNSYLAEGVGCTTFSFSLNLGCFFTFVPFPLNSVTRKDGVLVPHEYECHLRGRLLKTIEQAELSRADTWFIGRKGEYLTESISDALHQIQSIGLPWFKRFTDLREVIRSLEDEEANETFDAGTKGSPRRLALLGSAELHRQNQQLGIEYLKEALGKLSGFNTDLESTLRTYLSQLNTR